MTNRHPLFWAVDLAVLVITWYFWGIWDALLTAGVLTLGIFEGEVYANDRFETLRNSSRKRRGE